MKLKMLDSIAVVGMQLFDAAAAAAVALLNDALTNFRQILFAQNRFKHNTTQSLFVLILLFIEHIKWKRWKVQ